MLKIIEFLLIYYYNISDVPTMSNNNVITRVVKTLFYKSVNIIYLDL